MKSVKTALSFVALAATGAYGQTVAYSNFLFSDHSYDNAYVFAFGQDPNNSFIKNSLGFQFVSSVTGTVSNIYAAIDSYTGTPSSVNLAIYSDNGGTNAVPLAQLGDSLSATTAGTGSGFMHLVFNGSAGSMGASLTAGTAYWLVATAEDGIQDQWAQNPEHDGTTAISNNGNQSFQFYGNAPRGYMEIDVNPAPEPLMLVSLAAGLVGVLALKRKA